MYNIIHIVNLNVCYYVFFFFAVSRIRTRFRSFRTDYVKLKKRVQKGKDKSGSSPLHLTRLQKFKLARGKFVDAFCRQGACAQSQEMGPVSIPKLFFFNFSENMLCTVIYTHLIFI